jgi:hypothetical protein
MKKFSEYLFESVRNYEYTVKLLFKPTDDILTKIERALSRYELVDITAVRSQPIKRVDKDFPGISNPETYIFNVSVAYPAPAEFIRHTIANIGLELETVSVVTSDHEASVDKEDFEIAANTSDKALLDQDYPKQDNKVIADANYGDEYNSRLVKNAAGSTDQIIPKELRKEKGKTLNDPEFKIGEKSAMGSSKNKLPKVTSFAR